MISQISGINTYQKNSPSFGMALRVTKGATKTLINEVSDLSTAKKHLKDIGRISRKGCFDVILKKRKFCGANNKIKAVFKLKDPYKGLKNPFYYYIPVRNFQTPIESQSTSDIAMSMLEHVVMNIEQGAKRLRKIF